MSIIKHGQSATAVWDALATTDPDQTKPFTRGGGFKGTAVKPIYLVMKMTEQFGPVGTGWHIGKPEFQVMDAHGGERLVYCTVAVWIDGQQPVHGIGGDFVTKHWGGKIVNDDEAFKKAFTDAVGNALKYYGAAADIHMGLFDDSKYVAQVKAAIAAEKAGNGTDPPPDGQTKIKGKTASPKVNGSDKHSEGDLARARTTYNSIVATINACQSPEAVDGIVKEKEAALEELRAIRPERADELIALAAKRKTDLMAKAEPMPHELLAAG